MAISRVLVQMLIAGYFILGTAAMAAAPHSHDTGHDGGQLTLDSGKKWQTDKALQTGMAEIRKVMAASLDRIHHGKFSPAEYDALAGEIEAQIDAIVKTCHLPEQADAQLHLVLAQVMDGMDVMRGKGGDNRTDGAVTVIKALDAYGEYFDHKGWKPLTH